MAYPLEYSNGVLDIEMRFWVKWYAGIVAYLLVADLNTIAKSALQYLHAFGLGRELCIGDT